MRVIQCIQKVFYIQSYLLFYSASPLITRAVYGYGANSMTVVFYRSLFVIPMLAVIMKGRHISFSISAHDLRNTGIIAIFGSGLTTILLFTSYSYIDVGCATTLHFLYPVFVSLLCFAVYHEILSRRKLTALSLALLGALCFFDLSNSGSMLGLLLAAGSGLTYAFYMVQLEKTRLSHQNAYKISFYLAIFILLETLVYHLLFSSIQFILPWNAYGLILLLSLVSSFLDTGKDHRMLHYLYSADYHEQGSAYSGFFLSFLKIYPILHDDMGIGKNYDIMKTENSLFMKESHGTIKPCQYSRNRR